MWYANDGTVLANNPYYFADGSYYKPGQGGNFGSRTLDIYDNLNGSVNIAWPMMTAPVDSYNVYVNGILNQQVIVDPVIDRDDFSCVVTGLQTASYANGVKTPALNYDFKVVAVYNGVEVVASLDAIVTPGPTSVMLVTPMKRLWPFPNSGLD
jgi:hypothetical protein